jgi:TolB-like protein
VTPSPEEVRRQLERVLASETFANAERARRFLRYVVGRTLVGEGDQLKEFVIGVEVFDRDDSYDPRIDSIVRVEAGRLRAKLDQFYERASQDDTVIIRLPRGSYVPTFDPRIQSDRAAAGHDSATVDVTGQPTRHSLPLSGRSVVLGDSGRRLIVAGLCMAAIVALLAWNAGSAHRVQADPLVSILVLPLESFSTNERDEKLAAQLTDGITSELAAFDQLRVVSRTTAQQIFAPGRTLREMAQAVGADVVVEGSVVVGNEALSLDVRLVDAAADRKEWRRNFSGETANLQALQKSAAAAIAEAALGRVPQD